MPVQSHRRLLAVLLIAALLFLTAGPWACAAQAVDTYDKANPQNLTDDDLSSKAALLMDADTGAILYDKNGKRRTYPASTTKVMTCLIALENCALDEMVTITAEAERVPTDSSKTGVKAGEVMTLGDLLGGMMITSGNDAANAVAVHVAGTVSGFVDMMNQRAKELGCQDTHFVNAHGYHDEEHYSTAYDLALISREAMKNRSFREIVAAKSYTMAATALREKKTFATKNPMFVASSQYYYPDLIGIKTGYHSKAGQCFVGAAEKDGVLLISVVLKGANNDQTGKWTDTARLMDYGNTRYTTLTFEQLFSRAPVYASVTGAAQGDQNSGLVDLVLVPGSGLDNYRVRCLPEFEADTLKRFSDGLTVNYTSDLKAPVRAGDILGTLTMNMDGTPISATVVASRDVAAEPEPFSLRSLFPGVADVLDSRAVRIGLYIAAILIVIIAIARIRAGIRNRRRRREMLRRRRAAYDRYSGTKKGGRSM